jgi:hypothetical protein
VTGTRCTRCGATIVVEVSAPDARCPACGASSDAFEILASTAGDGGAQLEAFPDLAEASPRPTPVPSSPEVQVEAIEQTIVRALDLLDRNGTDPDALLSDGFADELRRVFTGLGLEPPRSDEPEDIEAALGEAQAELDRLHTDQEPADD